MSAASTSSNNSGVFGFTTSGDDESGHDYASFAPLFLSSEGGEQSFHPLDILARFFMLPVYGMAVMTRRTRYEVRIAALMLAIVGCFELTAWSFVFHQFSSGTAFDSLLVFGAALLVSAAMTMLERSILVSDIDVRGREYMVVWVKILFRLAIILFVAFRITSQPVELIAFHPSIEQRMFQEDVRRNLVAAATATINDLEDKQSKFDVLKDLNEPSASNDPRKVALEKQITIEESSRKIDQDNSRINSFQERVNTDTRDLAVARRIRDQAATQLSRSDSQAASEERIRNEAQLKDRENEVRRLESDRARSLSSIEASRRDKNTLETQRATDQVILAKVVGDSNQPANVKVLPSLKDFDDDFDHFNRYAARLVEAKSPKDIGAEFPFVRRDYSDVDQLVIVQDFRSGLPPFDEKLAASLAGGRLVNGTLSAPSLNISPFDKDATRVIQVFNQDSAQLHSQGQEDARRMQIIAIGKYWMILGVAVVVPMVALIYKVTAGRELKNYYSVRYQSGSFNPEALFQTTTEEFLQNEKHRSSNE